MARVLIVSLGSTGGLRSADVELCESLCRAGADAQIASAATQPQVPSMMLTDLLWARAARAAALAHLRREPADAIIYSSTTAALLWPRPGAIRFDAPSAGNRHGRHGLWQRPLERRRLERASLLLPWSEGGLSEVPAAARRGDRALVLPVPVEPSDPLGSVDPAEACEQAGSSRPPARERDIAAITYAANPLKKGLDRVLGAWMKVRRPSEELVVAGVSIGDLESCGLELPAEGVRLTGMLAGEEYRGLLRRARVFVCAPRREDYGQAQLEALADGCQLVSTDAPGPYLALAIARELDRRLVGEDLAGALRLALDEPLPGYPKRALELLGRLDRGAIDALVEHQLLPRLLAGAQR
jgi:glycosyltransferase involved in cell wall biosynthesis